MLFVCLLLYTLCIDPLHLRGYVILFCCICVAHLCGLN
ncbi:hypothetical protein CIPAW_15G070500 [Carya illinoinensis]|uniref:Uncharacterized protein n=1 Tax=Carya illinoinensis TaxID=32201 RepID=A0A8T1NCA4_CARIL|nr:hypothetical protein CIPAW_15G070500 [Carya illinoinensis]